MSAATGARSGPGGLLADRAYVELRDQIVTLAIPPGAPINEESLGRALGLGRTPLREAIKRLALENLVAVQPRRGTFVSAVEAADIVNINETTNYWENHLPFGGRAGTVSGIGRVGGRYPMETLTELQTVVINA